MGVAVLTNVMTNYIAGTPITFGSIIQTVGMTVFSSVVTFGIGDVVNTIGNLFVRATVQALAHGAFQGGLTAMNGGNFWNGFAAGALSSIASSLWQGGSHTTTDANGATSTKNIAGIGGVDGGGTTSMIAFGTIAGGAGAALTGGNFWQGAVTGLIVSGLNHAMHKMGNDDSVESNTSKNTTTTTQVDDTIKKISDALSAFGLGTDAKMAILAMAKGDMTAVSGYLKGMNVLGKVVGAGAIGIAAYQYYNEPTTANLLGLVGTTATVFAAGPAGSFVVGLMDVTGASNFIYSNLGNMIDNIAGYSVGNALHSNISGLFNNFNPAKP